ncbi:TonB-dependent receptor [Maribellus comscasis]|uniref:TonB-dependent receptor n=1 Tax=Maribellus comscasis TaxID=2681766 RepID=A0A6I6K0Q4_9BACT|nr:TonB-dependent receptor [Maribellus comscasis]QGY47179.1 TonB-dependent receptor [Maribellus comscasis]
MKKIILLTIFIVSVNLITRAQKKTTDANVIGDVQCDGEHVPFINVTIDGTTIGTTTDGTGHYQLINLPVGELTIRVSGMGYKSTSKTVTTELDKTIEIKFDIEKDVLNIESVVVTADRNQTNRAEAPVVVTSISPDLMANTQSVNIAEGLDFTPGLRTETNCQNCGFTQLRMNGMEGPYTQILMNSRPVFSGLAGVYGLELIPTNMVERLEVVRGGGSALFGGNAIAGTVNIITKEPARNSFNIDGRIGAIGIGGEEVSTPALDGQLNLNASVITDDRKTGGYIYSMLRNRDSYDANGDGYSEMVKLENTTFGFNVFHKPGSKSKISLDGYRISEFRRGGNKLAYLPHEADIAEQLDHLITGANLSFDLFTNGSYDKITTYASAQRVSRGSYYGAQRDLDAYGDTKNLTSSLGAHYNFHSDMFLFAPSTTIIGIDNTNDYLHDVKLGANGDANTTLIKQYVNTLGSFVQHDWKSEKVNVSLGLRYDYYWIKDKESEGGHSSNGVLVPRAGIMYKFTPELRFRVGYAKGYRAPQVFNEDLHIELVNATRVETFNSDDLKQETSNAFTASINSVASIGNTLNDFLIEGFYTHLKDPFSNEYYPLDDEGNFAYMRVNADDGAYVTGVNIEWKSFLTDEIETQIGFTLQTSKYESVQAWGDEETSVSKDFMRTPNQYGYATFTWKPTHHFNTSLSLNYTGSMYVPHFGLNPDDYEGDELTAVQEAIDNGDIIEGEALKKADGFIVADLLFSYDIHFGEETEMQFYAGVKNIFNQIQNDYDKGMYRDAGYIYGPSSPRTINFGIKFGNIF